MSDAITLIAALDDPNVRAFLRMIRNGEGTADEDGYRRMFGGKLFDSFADHPQEPQTHMLGDKLITSTAAGAYQFLAKTWDGLVRQYGFADFSPKNQDLGAVALIAGRTALDDVIAGRFVVAVGKCAREWASLPGSPYGQPVVSMAKAKAVYEAAGGAYSPVTTAPATAGAVPRERPADSATPPSEMLASAPPSLAAAQQQLGRTIPAEESVNMSPFLPIAFDAIASVVPQLIKDFGSGSEVAQRNARVVEKVVSAGKTALGAVNEQEVIERIQSDPAAAEAVRKAVADVYLDLKEVGGGIEAARKANEAYLQPGAAPFWLNPAILISVLLLAMPFMLLADVFYVHPQSYSGELRVQIVTGVLLIISLVGGYWLGTSASSQRKTELQAQGKP